jgi:septal ring factor EnvC (AmiA/AmiB activator)
VGETFLVLSFSCSSSSLFQLLLTSTFITLPKAAQKTLEDTLKKLTLTLNLNKEELKKAESSSKKYRNRQNGLETQLKELQLRLSNSEKAREDSEGRLEALKEHTLHLKEQLANAVSSLAPSVSSFSSASVTSLSSILAEIPPQLAGLVVLCLILSHLLAFQLG